MAVRGEIKNRNIVSARTERKKVIEILLDELEKESDSGAEAVWEKFVAVYRLLEKKKAFPENAEFLSRLSPLEARIFAQRLEVITESFANAAAGSTKSRNLDKLWEILVFSRERLKKHYARADEQKKSAKIEAKRLKKQRRKEIRENWF